MSANLKIGLEPRNGHGAGRDPRQMTADELAALGHQPTGPLKALRLHCIDCSGGSAGEVRFCTAVRCPAWPFRMGKNPWRAPASKERRDRARATIAARRALLAKNPGQGPALERLKEVPATTLPADSRAGETTPGTRKAERVDGGVR